MPVGTPRPLSTLNQPTILKPHQQSVSLRSLHCNTWNFRTRRWGENWRWSLHSAGSGAEGPGGTLNQWQWPKNGCTVIQSTLFCGDRIGYHRIKNVWRDIKSKKNNYPIFHEHFAGIWEWDLDETCEVRKNMMRSRNKKYDQIDGITRTKSRNQKRSSWIRISR